jgi:single-stranded-DNA-specific exonuclease
MLGSRINAGGRVGQSSLGMTLLSTEDPLQAQDIAHQLDAFNAERKAIEQLVQEQAMEQAIAQQLAGRRVIMVAGEGWHEGVIGIVAGRIKEHTGLPTAVLAIDGEVAKASARSVPGVDLGAAVVSAREEQLLIAGGGHAMAAGFTVATPMIADMHDYLEARLSDAVAIYEENKFLAVDAVVSGTALTAETAHELGKAAPYGMGNPAPRLAVANVRIRKMDILKEQHIKMMIQSDEGGAYAKAMVFRAVGTPLGEMLLAGGNGRLMHLAGTLKLDYWQGRESVTFHIDDAAWA